MKYVFFMLVNLPRKPILQIAKMTTKNSKSAMIICRVRVLDELSDKRQDKRQNYWTRIFSKRNAVC